MYRDTSTTVVLHLYHREMLLKEREHWGWQDGYSDIQRRVSRIVTNNDDTIQKLLTCPIVTWILLLRHVQQSRHQTATAIAQ